MSIETCITCKFSSLSPLNGLLLGWKFRNPLSSPNFQAAVYAAIGIGAL